MDEPLDIMYKIKFNDDDQFENVKIFFRFPVVAGDSRTGANINYENNHVFLRIMSYIQLKAMPAVPACLAMLPVDVSVNISLRLFFSNEVASDVYNVYPPTAASEIEVADIAEEMGYSINVIKPDKFQVNFKNRGRE